MIKTQTTCSYTDIFYFAKEHFGIGWNDCCDMFHRSEILRQEGIVLYLRDIKYELESSRLQTNRKAYEVLRDFLEANALDEVLVLYDN